MHLCHVLTRDMNSSQIVPGEARINEEQVAEAAPGVRALVVQRLEQVWRACEPHINPRDEELEMGFRRDPRYIEAGIRVLDRLVAIYGLTKPTQVQADPDAGSSTDQRAAVAKLVAELEQRLPKGTVD
jgi:hypothetical protein